MNQEIKELDEMMCGLIPGEFGAFGNGAANRTNTKYAWNDLDFNLNSFPFETDTAIIVTSYHGQLGWLKATLSSYRKSGAYVILAYDNPCYIWSNLQDKEFSMRYFPHPHHYLLAHSVVVKHKTYDADKRTGWFWDVWYAQGIIKNLPNIKYVYCTNGDCIVEKPEGFGALKEYLGDGDFMSGQSTRGGTIHTADILMKVDAFHKIMDYMTGRMKHTIMGSQSPESLLRDAVDYLSLKETYAEQPIDPKDGSIDYYGKCDAESTFKKLIGFKNLYHLFEWHENNGHEPDFKRFMDPYQDWMYWREDWRNTICRYFETGDRRYLMMFWDRGKDSDYERKYLPLESYGGSPIYALA